jgi:hypothetical protein
LNPINTATSTWTTRKIVTIQEKLLSVGHKGEIPKDGEDFHAIKTHKWQ